MNDLAGSGAIAQLGERLLCKQEVTGSIPVGSTRANETERHWLRAEGDQSIGCSGAGESSAWRCELVTIER